MLNRELRGGAEWVLFAASFVVSLTNKHGSALLVKHDSDSGRGYTLLLLGMGFSCEAQLSVYFYTKETASR